MQGEPVDADAVGAPTRSASELARPATRTTPARGRGGLLKGAPGTTGPSLNSPLLSPQSGVVLLLCLLARGARGGGSFPVGGVGGGGGGGGG